MHTVFNAEMQTWDARALRDKPMLSWVHHHADSGVYCDKYLSDITPDGKFFVMMYVEARHMHVVDVNEMSQSLLMLLM